MPERCPWIGNDPLYQHYHDHEWGVPIRERRPLFELLCLEGQQAGLAWITVLNKREHYRQRFFDFQPEKVAALSDMAIEQRLTDAGLIRNKLKLYAIRNNAHALLNMEQQDISFVDFIWQFSDDAQQQNYWQSMDDVPTSNDASHSLSIALKQQGFSFVGNTICYAFMQAAGLINDHLVSCYRHKQCQQPR